MRSSWIFTAPEPTRYGTARPSRPTHSPSRFPTTPPRARSTHLRRNKAARFGHGGRRAEHGHRGVERRKFIGAGVDVEFRVLHVPGGEVADERRRRRQTEIAVGERAAGILGEIERPRGPPCSAPSGWASSSGNAAAAWPDVAPSATAAAYFVNANTCFGAARASFVNAGASSRTERVSFSAPKPSICVRKMSFRTRRASF